MKSLHVGAAALALTLALAGCGGKASFEITGTISGLTAGGLKLSTGGQDVKPDAGATSFVFPHTLSYGDAYDIVQTSPPLHMGCIVTNGKGTAGQFSTIAATVTCSKNSYAVGGTITGMTVAGLVLANGSAPQLGFSAVVADGTAYTFPNLVEYGTSYGITVLTQPAGLFCSVSNGTAVMAEAVVTNVNVKCVPAT